MELIVTSGLSRSTSYTHNLYRKVNHKDSMYALWSKVSLAVSCLVFMCTQSALSAGVNKHRKSLQVLVVSIGGFRVDYLSKLNLPNMNKLISQGTTVQYVENSLNVLDIVDHTSVVTGLYPESHGIIADTMYDPIINKVFNRKTRNESVWWNHVHPIWKEIEKQGLGNSALCHWPGAYGSIRPTLHCGEKENLKANIAKSIKWLHDGVKLVLLHTDVIKKQALRWGPFSPKTINEIQRIDAVIEDLVEKTRDLSVDILVMSDSGVTELNNRVVNLDACLNPKSYVLPQSQATLFFYPQRGYIVDEIYRNLTQCKHLKVYLKKELPRRFHFTNNPRIPPIVAFASLGTRVTSSKHLKSQLPKGGEGYHPGYEVMRGMLIGYGPSFPRGLKLGAVKNVDIYPLMCNLLNITPRPNNGSYDTFKSKINDVMPLSDDVSNSKIIPPVLPTSLTTRRISRQMWIKEDVEWLFWLLAGLTGLLFVVCIIGCFATMYVNHKHGDFHKTKVREPAVTTLLSDDSSEDERLF